MNLPARVMFVTGDTAAVVSWLVGRAQRVGPDLAARLARRMSERP